MNGERNIELEICVYNMGICINVGFTNTRAVADERLHYVSDPRILCTFLALRT